MALLVILSDQGKTSWRETNQVLKKLPPTSREWRILRNRAIVLTFFDTGLRAAELCGVRRDDADPRELVLRVSGKSGKEREVAISPVTARACVIRIGPRLEEQHWPAPQALRDMVCLTVHRRPSSHLPDTGKGSEKTEVLPSASVAVAVM